MKNTLTLFLIPLFGSFGFGQITVIGADLPQANTTFLVGNDTTSSVNLGSPGASWQQWDFSGLVNHYYKVADFDSTSQTPYAGDFPTSNVDTYGPSIWYTTLYGGAPVDQSSNGYMFWLSDNTGFWAIGFRTDTGPYAGNNVHETPPELLIGAPATYGSSFNNTSFWELAMDENNANIDTFYIVHRTKTIDVDAWGELITPYGTFTDVIRYHEYTTEQDSVRSEFGIWDSTFFLATDTVNIYTYMANSIGYPVAIVHADKNNVVQNVEYLLDSTVVAGIPYEEIDFKYYPNPCPDKLTIELNQQLIDGRISILNVLGEIVLDAKTINESKIILDLSYLQSGTYFIFLSGQNGIRSKQIIVNH